MRFVLDGSSVGSREALHRTLHDCLTDITEPTELVIRGGAALETALGGYAAALQRVLADCAAENEMFSVTWEE